MKDRYVPISSQMLLVLSAFRKKYPSDDFVFKTHGKGVTPQRITPPYVRTILKNALTKASLDPAITIHALRHSAVTHLLENGENILNVQKRLGHARVTTTLVYLHVAVVFYHPHLHCIVPGGGIDKSGAWHQLKGCKGSNFLFPVAAMSPRFRRTFMALLTKRLEEIGVDIDRSARKRCFDKDWVVYARPPAKGVNQVLEYIARYAYRVAITNSSPSPYSAGPVC